MSLTAALPGLAAGCGRRLRGFAPLAIDCRRSAAGISTSLRRLTNRLSRSPSEANALSKTFPARYTPPRSDGAQRLAAHELTQPRRHALDRFWAIAYVAAFLQTTDERIEPG